IRGSLACAMKPKPDTPPEGRIDAAYPRGRGDRRRKHLAGGDGRRRPRLTEEPNGLRGRKSKLGRPIRGGSLRFVQPDPDVVDNFPKAIPVASRELDVIETYLGALLDEAFGGPE